MRSKSSPVNCGSPSSRSNGKFAQDSRTFLRNSTGEFRVKKMPHKFLRRSLASEVLQIQAPLRCWKAIRTTLYSLSHLEDHLTESCPVLDDLLRQKSSPCRQLSLAYWRKIPTRIDPEKATRQRKVVPTPHCANWLRRTARYQLETSGDLSGMAITS